MWGLCPPKPPRGDGTAAATIIKALGSRKPNILLFRRGIIFAVWSFRLTKPSAKTRVLLGKYAVI